jgi:hypothetical protein
MGVLDARFELFQKKAASFLKETDAIPVLEE